MSNLDDYLRKRGISDEQMDVAQRKTREMIEAYALREARKARNMTQVELAREMGVSQNRVSRMENGDLGTMSLDAIRRYVEALGGKISLVAKLPSGDMHLI